MRSVALRLTKTGDNHQMQSSTRYPLSLPPSLDLFLRLPLFADWISAQFSLTLDLLSLQSPPLAHLKADTASPVSFPLLLVFRVRHTFSTSEKKRDLLFLDHREGWNGVIDSHIYVTLTSITAPACLPVRLATELPNAFGVFLLLYPPSICSQLPREDSSDAGL